MRLPFLQILKVWLATLAVLQATLAAGVPIGLTLCFGCEGPDEAGWSIAAPCAATPAEASCCGTDAPAADGRVAATDAANTGCDCVDLPLPVGTPESAIPTARDDTRPLGLADGSLSSDFAGWVSTVGASAADRLRAARAPALLHAAAPFGLTPFGQRTVLII